MDTVGAAATGTATVTAMAAERPPATAGVRALARGSRRAVLGLTEMA